MQSRFSGWRLPALVAVVVGLGVASCAPAPTSNEVLATAQPKSAAVQNMSSVTEALRCMDTQFFRAPPTTPIILISQGVRDETQKATGNDTREILFSAYSEMTARSQAFTFLDFDSTQADIEAARMAVRDAQQAAGGAASGLGLGLRPTHYVRVAITQADENVVASKTGMGLSIPALGPLAALPSLNFEKGQQATLISVDMNLVDFATRRVISGVTSKNSLAVVRTGTKADGEGRANRAPSKSSYEEGNFGSTSYSSSYSEVAGGSFLLGSLKLSYSMDKNETISQGVRKLVELGFLEIMGKALKVPYWQCLNVADDNQEAKAMLRKNFDGLNDRDRNEGASRLLRSQGYMRDGGDSRALAQAVTRFQIEKGLPQTGRVDFATYERLMAGGEVATAPLAAGPVLDGPAVVPDINLNATSGYGVGDRILVTVRSAREQYLRCYYKDSQSRIVQILPNRFQPSPTIAAKEDRNIGQDPAGKDYFTMVAETGGAQEQILCINSGADLFSRLPPRLQGGDLTPLPLQSLDEIVTAFKEVDALGVAARKVDITVQ